MIFDDKQLEIWQDLLTHLANLLNVPAALIMKVSGHEIKVFISSKTKNNPYKVGDKEEYIDSGLYCETVIKTREKLIVPNALKDKNWDNNPDIKINMISYLGYPLYLPNGEVFGTICVLDNKENHYSEEYCQLLYYYKDLIESHMKSHEWIIKAEKYSLYKTTIKCVLYVLNTLLMCFQILKSHNYEIDDDMKALLNGAIDKTTRTLKEMGDLENIDIQKIKRIAYKNVK